MCHGPTARVKFPDGTVKRVPAVIWYPDPDDEISLPFSEPVEQKGWRLERVVHNDYDWVAIKVGHQ